MRVRHAVGLVVDDAEELHELGRAERAPGAEHVEEVLGGAAGLTQALDDAPSFAVERDQARRRRVEHHHADGGGVDQRLEGRARARRSSRKARALATATAACAANSTSSSSSSAVKPAAPAFSASQKLPTCSPRWRIGVPWKVRYGSRPSPSKPSALRCEARSASRMGAGEAAQALEQPRAVRPLQQAAVLGLAGAAGDEVLGLSVGVDGGDGPVAGAGQRARAVDDLAEQGRQVEAGADAHARRAQRRDALTQGVGRRPRRCRPGRLRRAQPKHLEPSSSRCSPKINHYGGHYSATFMLRLG